MFVGSVTFFCINTQTTTKQIDRLEVFPSITNISADFFLLPNLQTVLLDFTGFDAHYFQFDTFNGYSSSLKTVSLSWNDKICNGSIMINNTQYSGFYHLGQRYFNQSQVENDETQLLKFIQTFDPCYQPCDSWTCLNQYHTNGLCNEYCNNEACGYDGGDCNQLCSCDYNLWFNDQCDLNCNNSLCNYDFYQCDASRSSSLSDGNADANSTCFEASINLNKNASNNNSNNSNITDSGNNEDIKCYTSWIDDSWCDSNCFVTECEYDGDDCSSDCVGHCQDAYTYMIGYLANINQPNELMTMDEICDNIDIIKYISPNIDQGFENNCSQLFDFYDTNNNSFIGFHEAIVATADGWGFQDLYYHANEKLQQVDCSQCMHNSSLYDW